MTDVPVTSNVVYIPMVTTNCLNGEFDSTYPIYLNGIIRPDEFQQSIANINRSFSSSNKYFIRCCIFFVVTIMIAPLCFALMRTKEENSGRYFALLIIGIVASLTEFVCIFIGSFYVFKKRVIQMRQAIEEESAKYSSRSIPCNWKYDFSRAWFGDTYSLGSTHNLIIQIGSSYQKENNTIVRFSTIPSSDRDFDGNLLPPKTCYGPPVSFNQPPRYCSSCNKSRDDLNARFCSGCGHNFSTY
ncbi:unnamed protein product [Adineta steineri]|uniref:Uncharacterized protein n=1 Tax=Adineta steineri TaxID=433720 RepID=A0A814STS6_9BILA|nr:unnamed protein product [Adineta steineri]CAF1340643.1 unnamed protein product [Adineta steineri]